MKIGIVTHYYKSKNYGGNLQAYALCKAIEKLGFTAEQIPYDRQFDGPFWGKNKAPISILVKKVLRKVRAACVSFSEKKKNEKLIPLFEERSRTIENFNINKIPHSEKVFTAKNIKDANSLYDVFITGSDQVWHPDAVCGAYLLDFASEDKTKVSYAASLAVGSLTDVQKKRYSASLSSFDFVSVREAGAVSLIEDICPQKPVWVLDPTLLLEESEWNELVGDDEKYNKHNIESDYVFCYFLGDDKNSRKAASDFAKKKGLKLVTIPYLHGKARECDDNFADVNLFDVCPLEFISLIKNAKYIFTDSFHASVFSLIFRREFFVFERRAGGVSMGSRIESLVSLFDLKERYIVSGENVNCEYVSSLSEIDYTREFPKFIEARQSSFNFLKDSLAGVRGKESGYED